MIGIEEDDNGTKQTIIDNLDETKEKLVEEAQDKLSAVWQKIFDTAFMLCPVESGTLQSTIQLIEGDSTPEGASYTPEGGGGEKAVTIYNSTIIAGDAGVTKPDGTPCIYAEWVHDGHFGRGGNWIEGQPFLESAILEHEIELDEAINEVMDAIGAQQGGGTA
jgi:hypothetical protein